MSKMDLDSPVRYVPGVGEKKAQALSRLGVVTVGDLLYHFPRGYQNRGDVYTLADAPPGEQAAYILTVGTQPKNALIKNRMTLTKFTAFDETRSCTTTFFNQPYVKDVFEVGRTFRFWGRIEKNHGITQMNSPLYEPYSEELPPPDFVPVYPLTAGVTQKYLSKIIKAAYSAIDRADIPDPLPETLREENGLPSVSLALRYIHFPECREEIELARTRFLFEDYFVFALSVVISKRNARSGVSVPMGKTDMKPFAARLEFELTGAQKRVINQIYADMTSPKRIPMTRLVSGDVGSGKTVCAAAAAYIAAKNGYQSALLVPTEILANQHFNDLYDLLQPLGINTALLTGSTGKKARSIILEKLASGEIDLLIGTHAVLGEGVVFKAPALFITDEQHRFGVMQRAALAEKANIYNIRGGTEDIKPHILVMSATPIPRTLALILWGDLDVSTIDEMPPGRQKVGTFLVDESYRERLNGFIRKQAQEGRQTYIVCPSIEDSRPDEKDPDSVLGGRNDIDLYSMFAVDRDNLKSAKKYAETLQNEVFPDLKIALLHGRMSGKEKDRVMTEFAAGNIDVLVSTTVIEVGVNVPNATLMVVENAERFGLSQLHQLRGRVGRGRYRSWCILVSDAKYGQSYERLKAMTENSDGFAIAQKDLEIRGPGDFFPSKSGRARQHGAFSPGAGFAEPDTELMKTAFAEAAALLERDPDLEDAGSKPLYDKVNELYEINENTIS